VGLTLVLLLGSDAVLRAAHGEAGWVGSGMGSELVLCRGSVRWFSDSECVLAEAYWFDCVVVVVGGRAVLMLEGG
jgi:hypothetical protein